MKKHCVENPHSAFAFKKGNWISFLFLPSFWLCLYNSLDASFAIDEIVPLLLDFVEVREKRLKVA